MEAFLFANTKEDIDGTLCGKCHAYKLIDRNIYCLPSFEAMLLTPPTTKAVSRYEKK